jgi:signal transduction histidine kinase
MTSLRKLLKPQLFEDEVETEKAYLLYVILWILICVPIPYLLFIFLKGTQYPTRALIQARLAETVNGILLVMLHRGYVKSTAILQVSAFWLFFTATAITGSGVQGEAYLLGYGLVIAIAGILLGGTGSFIFTQLSLASGWLMVQPFTLTLMDPGFGGPPPTTWTISLVLFPVGAVVQSLASRVVRNSLTRARASEERYHLISRVTSDYTFSTELDARGSMQLNWVAGAFKEITGYDYEEYVSGGGWPSHPYPAGVVKDENDMDILHTNKKVISEVRHFNKSRDLRWARVYVHLIPDGLHIHAYDVTNNIPPGHEIYGVKDFAAVAVWGGNIISPNQLEALRLYVGYAGLAIENARQNTSLQTELAHRQTFIDELEAKNAELERFSYTVSHNLKSPLVTIVVFLGYVEKDALAGNSERARSGIARISSAAKKMEHLLHDLLELSRIDRLMNPAENVSFAEIVREALERVRGGIDEHKIQTSIADDLPVVHGDRIRLIEVVQNLLDNAAKFSSESTNPCIDVGIKGMDENLHPILFVSDNGIGIAPEFHERIFGLFNKLNPQAEGTGIGLTLVKRIIEVHGGRIWVESTPAHGATFHFTLPAQNHVEAGK